MANYLNENTVQIGAPSSVTVMSVQFTDDYMSEYELDETNKIITYMPTTDFNGPTQFTYTISDGALTSTQQSTINVAAVNNAPVAAPDDISATEDTAEIISFSLLLSILLFFGC